MSSFDDTFCQICESFITKEEWDKHLYSNRHLHREVNGYWPAYFTQRKLTGYESNKLEKAFWKMFFETRYIKEVDEFLITYFLTVTNMKDHIPDHATVRKVLRNEFRDIMEEQFCRDLYNKTFTSEVKENEQDSLKKRVSDCVFIASNKGPIPNNVYDYKWVDIFDLVLYILKQPGEYDKKAGRYHINEVLPRV